MLKPKTHKRIFFYKNNKNKNKKIDREIKEEEINEGLRMRVEERKS